MRRSSLPVWSVPLVYLSVTLAAYGLFAAQQGYHWDDWGFAWVSHYIGKPGLDAYFALSRPFWSNLYVVTTSFLGPNPFDWQVFGLAARWLLAVALWWVLRLTWQGHPRLAFTAGLLALLYPGFSQHSISLIYGHYSLTFALFFVSVALGLLAMRTQRLRWLLITGGVVFSALHLFSVEYYFGLELLRPVLMWVVAGEATRAIKPRLMNTLKFYLPFGAVLAAFGLWRALGFESAAYDLGERQASITLASLISDTAHSIWNASISAWGSLFQLPPSEEMGRRLILMYAGILIAALVGVIIFVLRIQPTSGSTDAEPGKKPFLEWFSVGGIAVILAGIPFFVVNLQIKLTFPSDRFTQPFALGTALLLAAGLELIPRLSWRAVVTGSLAALAIGVQIQNAFAFREDWRLQESYFWQLAWRAPGLKPGTVIVSEKSPFRFTDDDALTFGVNWLYEPEYEKGNLSYGQVFLTTRPGELLTPGQPVEWKLISTDFISTTDSMIILQFDKASCLRVLHPLYDADMPLAPLSDRMTDSLAEMGYPLLRQGTQEALPLSNMEQVIPDPEKPARPPEVVFGEEPAHQWCYYFEKADLARSVDDWAEVARLGDEAFAVPFRPNNPSEYLPFIEAYARLGRMKEAKKLTLETAHQMPVLRPMLCALWQRVSASGVISGADQTAADEIQSSLQYCPVEGK